ncbi:hypothetical protein T459_04864 [Capsicum annuum]|uniref:Ubiquitin-like protease family profile domain-containing protein n=1 Tax=Capsicum annuum TaxID=4072 RepID=A0A2G3A6D4_CAPAN|nr:hypothetical protein T459_04864 [Capsicum annuum]
MMVEGGTSPVITSGEASVENRRKRVDVIVKATTEENNIIVDNPSTASKDEEKVELVSSGEWKNYPFEGFNILDKSEVSQNEECLINIIKGSSILTGLPWYLVDEVHISINCGDELYWVLAIVVLKKRLIRVYDSISRRRRSRPSLRYKSWPNYCPLTLICVSFWIKRDCGLFVVAYAEYLSDGLQVPNDGLDVGLLHKRYAAILWKYREAKDQKP